MRRSEVERRCALDEILHQVSLLTGTQVVSFSAAVVYCYQHHAGPSKHPPVGSSPSWITVEGVYRVSFAGFK